MAYIAHGQTPDGQRFLAMEWLEGHDLAQRLSRGPLPLPDALLVVERVAEALTAAHGRGIVHRDLKPRNLFLPAGDISRCKLLDFGIARRLATAQAMTRTGMVVGTPEYMAPEQARGSRELTPATDIFSLGCVLYECLTGAPPFVAEHIAAVLVRILFEEPASITTRRPGVPEAVASLIDDMLNKNAAQRPADAAALLRCLSQIGDVPELPLLPTLAASVAPASMFAENEQVLFSLVVAAGPQQAAPLASTLFATSARTDAAHRASLLSALRTLGARAEYLLDGVLVVRVPQLGNAQDQATMAARVALFVRDRWPEATVAVATGRGTTKGTTAIGEVADRAAQILERHAGEDARSPTKSVSGVWLDELSARLVDPRFTIAITEEGTLLTSEKKEVDDSRPLLGKPTPCVGRDTELGILEGLLNGCIEESEARVVLITAPPGVGKSRLRHEFLNRVGHRSKPLTVILGRGDLTNAGSPYGILGQAVRRLCGISGGEPIETQREQLRQRVGQHLVAQARERVTLFVGEFSGIPFSEENQPMLISARQDPRILFDAVRQAFIEWLRAECQATPVLIALDDLQWGDALSVELLDDALHQLREAPLFVLALGRPELKETFHKLWQAHKPQELPLKGLSKKASERLVQHMLGNQVTPEGINRIVEQSAGNALFLEELIRSVLDGTSERPAETVLAMLQARIGRLDPGPRRAMLAASLFGQTFLLGGVTQVLGHSTISTEVESWLLTLSEQEFIEPHASSQLAGHREYGFRHALVREAAYALLTDNDRITGHSRAGQFLETADGRDPATIAEHYERGGDKLHASIFYARAAEQFVDRCALETALRHADRASACGAESELMGVLQGIQAMAYSFTGRLDQAFPIAMAALPSLRPGSHSWGRAVFGGLMAAVFGPPEWKAEIPALATQVLLTDPDRDAERIYAEVLQVLISGMCTAVPVAQCQALLSRLDIIGRRAAPHNPTLWRYRHVAYSRADYHCAPFPWKTLREAEAAERLCRQAGDVRTGGWVAVFVIAPSWLDLGGLHAAEEVLSSYWDLACATHERLLQSAIQTKRAALFLLGRDKEADGKVVAYANETIARMAAVPAAVGESYDLLARVLLKQGRAHESEAAARRACHHLEGLPNYVPNAHATLIFSLLAQGKTVEAINIANKGLDIIRFFGCLGHAEVELRLAVSEAFQSAGESSRAHGELRETLCQVQIRADDIIDPVWRNSYLTRNPYCARAQLLGKEWDLDIVVK